MLFSGNRQACGVELKKIIDGGALLSSTANNRRGGGGGGIRTPETLSGLTVFKTAGFNRSPTPPFPIITAINT